MLTRIKDNISRIAQRALEIDAVRFKLDGNSSKLGEISSKLDGDSSKLDQISSKLHIQLARLDPKLQNLAERSDSLFWQSGSFRRGWVG